MIAPASDQLAEEFGITNATVIALVTSIFVLAYGTLCVHCLVCVVCLTTFHSAGAAYFGPAERNLRPFTSTPTGKLMVFR